MKIAFDAKRLFSNYTGLGNYSRTLVRNLAATIPEQEYHLFAPELKHNLHTDFFFGNAQFHLHESKSRLKAYWRSFGIVNDLQKSGIQLYHGLSNEIPHRIHKSGIASVVTIHDLIFKTQADTYSLSERVIYDKKFRYACLNADKIIAISQNTKNDIIRFYQIPEEKIAVIYQACNPLFYQLQSQEQLLLQRASLQLPEQYFLYVGSVEKRKNLKLIIEAYSQQQALQQTPCLVVGKGGAYKKECQSMIAQLGLEHCFVWMDNLADNYQLQALYQMATALIYPSHYEGFGLPIAEALLSNTAVIAAQTSCLSEAGGPDSLYIAPNDAAALAHNMQLLLTDTHLRQQIAQKGKQFAHNNFDPQTLSQQLQQLYQDLV